jgi:hypothetical protein
MDRFKEALDQFVRGEWLSSISLCGDIVEFIVNEFWSAYSDWIEAERRSTPSDSVMRNLDMLLLNGVIDVRDYERLHLVRGKRDAHVHSYPRNKLLGQNYETILRNDSVESIRILSEFFAAHNVESKYERYLEYASNFIAPM